MTPLVEKKKKSPFVAQIQEKKKKNSMETMN